MCRCSVLTQDPDNILHHYPEVIGLDGTAEKPDVDKVEPFVKPFRETLSDAMNDEFEAWLALVRGLLR